MPFDDRFSRRAAGGREVLAERAFREWAAAKDAERRAKRRAAERATRRAALEAASACAARTKAHRLWSAAERRGKYVPHSTNPLFSFFLFRTRACN